MRVIITAVDKSKYLTMKASIDKSGVVEKLIIYNDTYKIEEIEGKDFRYKKFDEVEIDKVEDKNDSN